jgi:hypothetical protein
MPLKYKEILDEEYYLDIRENTQFGVFISIFDKEVIEKETVLKGARYNKVLSGHEIKRILSNAVSIIFYGDKAVKLGIILKYVHPEAIAINKGIKTAIYIKTF